MSNVTVPANSDQTPVLYVAPVFVNSEAPTSAKLTAFGQFVNSEFGVLSIAVGNPFIHGIPSLGGAVGTLAELTQPILNSNNLIATTPALFNSSNQNINEIQAIVGTLNSSGLYPVTLINGVIGINNIIAGPGSTFNIVNVAIVSKDSNGNINKVYPGYFTPVIGYTSGPIAQFNATFGDIPPIGSCYIEVVNYSLSDAISDTITNIGSLSYGRLLGYTDSNDIIQTITGSFLPTITSEINASENKGFAIKWHARLSLASPSSTDASNNYWVTTGSATTWQAGSLPTPGTITSYIANLATALIIPANNNVIAYASANGSPLLDSSNNIVSPTNGNGLSITYNGTTLTIAISNTIVSNLQNAGVSLVDVYFPALIPQRLLQSNNLNYDSENSTLASFASSIIGYQYGYAQNAARPNTVATRLDNDEANIASVTSFANSIGSNVIPNGSFEYGSITPYSWVVTSLNGGTYALDTSAGNYAHGSQSIKLTVNTSGVTFGGGTITSQNYIPCSDQSTYYIKWKTKSTIATMSNSVGIQFWDGLYNYLGTITIWTNSATNPTASFGTFYGNVVSTSMGASNSIPSGARWMKIILTGGALNSPSGNVWYDDVEFFTPSKYGQTIVYSTAGTFSFTTPSDCVSITADLVSAGGGGGGWNSNNNGGGGGGGAYSKLTISVNPDTVYTIVVGAGGAGQVNGNAGGSGGDSAFGTYGIAGGGGGPAGVGGGYGGSGYGILPTITSGALVLQSLTGADGGNGQAEFNTGGNGGTGGSAANVANYNNGLFSFTSGTSSGNTSGAGQDGSPGTSYGGGGVGAIKNHGGGTGANGIVIVYF